MPTVTGEDSVDATYADCVKVSGGADRDALSKFDGPTLFTNKVTSTSADGIETVSVNLQGDAKAARKLTVGISTPVVGGASGDVVLHQTIREWICWLGLYNSEQLEKIWSCI